MSDSIPGLWGRYSEAGGIEFPSARSIKPRLGRSLLPLLGSTLRRRGPGSLPDSSDSRECPQCHPLATASCACSSHKERIQDRPALNSVCSSAQCDQAESRPGSNSRTISYTFPGGPHPDCLSEVLDSFIEVSLDPHTPFTR